MKKLFTFIGLLLLIFTQSAIVGWKNGQAAPLDPREPDEITSTLPIAHGAHIRPVVEYGQEIKEFNSLMQKDLAIVMYFLDWSENSADIANGSYIDPWLLNRIRASFGDNGPVIMLSWMPMNARQWLGNLPSCDRDYEGGVPLQAIINGACDNYIRGFAQSLKARPERFLIRFAAEMNIADSPWWPGHFDGDASLYVQMWRHVHQVFTSQQVPNVEWVWSVNYASNPVKEWNNIHNYYPGDDFVDWIGLSGYNWYKSFAVELPWMTFTDLYDQVLKDLSCHYAKPLMLTEIGSVDGPGGSTTKAAWISDTYQRLPQYPFMRSILWFNDFAHANTSAADFRVSSSSGTSGGVFPLPSGVGTWTNAYRQAVASSIYATYLPSRAASTPPFPYCSTDGAPEYRVSPSSAMLKPGTSSNHRLDVIMPSGQVSVSLEFPSGSNISGSISPGTLSAPWSSAAITIQTSQSTAYGKHTVYVNAGSTRIPLEIIVVDRVYPIYLPVAIK